MPEPDAARPPAAPPAPPPATDERIASALERIADALESVGAGLAQVLDPEYEAIRLHGVAPRP